MKNCTYKSLLAEAFGKKPLLPVSPNAYFGTALHKVLELIVKGEIASENDFDTVFNEQIELQEENLKRMQYDFFVPLQTSVKDYGLKKVLLRKHWRKGSKKLSAKHYFSEKWFESKDGMIGGRIDLVIEDRDNAEIIDFKTGALTQDILEGEISQEIKPEYADQLKMYAYLYFETTGYYPKLLSLVDLASKKINVDFSHEECLRIYTEAKELLNFVNNCVDKGNYTANPSNLNCVYCLYRPACSFYLDILERENPFNDVTGTVEKVIRFQNGNISVFLVKGDRKIAVTGITSKLFDSLSDRKGKQISVFNLKRVGDGLVYSATKTTVFYEY